jgi:hypothetical protein
MSRKSEIFAELADLFYELSTFAYDEDLEQIEEDDEVRR